MIKSYEDLEVYQRSYAAALDVHKLTLDFPQIEQFSLASQIRRSTKSICGNIAEGYAKQHSSITEFKRFIDIAIGSSEESRVWLNFAKDLDYITPNKFDHIHNEYDEISKMLHGLRKNWKSKTPLSSPPLTSQKNGAIA